VHPEGHCFPSESLSVNRPVMSLESYYQLAIAIHKKHKKHKKQREFALSAESGKSCLKNFKLWKIRLNFCFLIFVRSKQDLLAVCALSPV